MGEPGPVGKTKSRIPVRTLQSTPGSHRARLPMFGMSFVYVIFNDGTDHPTGRARVLEQMGRVQQPRHPMFGTPVLGPDATGGVGWVYQYVIEDIEQASTWRSFASFRTSPSGPRCKAARCLEVASRRLRAPVPDRSSIRTGSAGFGLS